MKQVKSLRQLCSLALRRKSVICPNSPCFNKSIPAGFMCNLQGWIINRLIVSGMYVYVPKKKTKGIWDACKKKGNENEK